MDVERTTIVIDGRDITHLVHDFNIEYTDDKAFFLNLKLYWDTDDIEVIPHVADE